MANTYYHSRKYLTVGGGTIIGNLTMTGHLLFSADNTYDIGASGATRPRSIYVGTNATIGGTIAVTGAATFSSTVATGALSVTGAITATTTITATTNIQATQQVTARSNATQLGVTPTNRLYTTAQYGIGAVASSTGAANTTAVYGRRNNAASVVGVTICSITGVAIASLNNDYILMEIANDDAGGSAGSSYDSVYKFKKLWHECQVSTKATLNAITAPAGAIAVCSDSGAGVYAVVVGNGTNWINCTTGATLA